MVHSRMHTATNVFISSLAMSDLLFMVGIPFIITTRITIKWVLGERLCDIIFFLMFICGSSSIVTMSAISFDRWILICHPQWRHLTKVQAVGVAFLMWLLAIGISVPLAISFSVGNQFGEEYLYCTIIWPPYINGRIYIMVATMFLLIIPTVFITVNYGRIFYTIRESQRRVRGNKPSSISSQQLRLIKLLVTIVNLFATMYTPFFVLNVLLLYTNVPVSSTHYTWCVILCLLNAAGNPYVYFYFNDNFRLHFLNYIRCRCRSEDEASTLELQSTLGRNGSMRCSTKFTTYDKSTVHTPAPLAAKLSQAL